MDQPRQGFEIKRSIDEYIIKNARLPKMILLRDIALTVIMWGVYGIAFYRAFLYVEGLYLINRLPNLNKQQKVVMADFYEDLKIYLIILLILVSYMLIRLVSNLGKWRRMRKNSKVTVPIVTVGEQAEFFKANEQAVVEARRNKICIIDTSSEDGSVLSIEIIK